MEDFETPKWQRNQLVEALWKYSHTALGHANKSPGEVTQIFESRIIKMLYLDRKPLKPSRVEMSGDKWAFYHEAGRGPGTEEQYSTIQVFIMSISMDLQYIGLKQREVIYYLSHTKSFLSERFKLIHASSNERVQRTGARSRSSTEETVWMAIWREEPPEHKTSFLKSPGSKESSFSNPEFVEGLDMLHDRFVKNMSKYRHAILLEIAGAARRIPKYLEKTTASRRGRKEEGV